MAKLTRGSGWTVVRRRGRIPAKQARLDGAPPREIPCAAGPRSERKGSAKLVASGRSSSCSSRWSGCPGVLGTRRRKELGTAELGGTRARVWGGVARWGLGSQRRRVLYRAAQVILGRRAPDGRLTGNLGLTGGVVALRGRRNCQVGSVHQRQRGEAAGRA